MYAVLHILMAKGRSFTSSEINTILIMNSKKKCNLGWIQLIEATKSGKITIYKYTFGCKACFKRLDLQQQQKSAFSMNEVKIKSKRLKCVSGI